MPSEAQIKKQWFRKNYPSGKAFGYPDCCIREFGKQPPELIKGKKPSKSDVDRFKAGCTNGEFTGLIPCTAHSVLILSGKITLASLIKNRRSDLPPFPLV